MPMAQSPPLTVIEPPAALCEMHVAAASDTDGAQAACGVDVDRAGVVPVAVP
jgi:hypothetical protein